MIRLRTPFLAAALFTGVAAVGLAPAFAQTAPGPVNSTATPSEARHHEMERMMPGQLVDGRIAFLKAELKITPAQETQWQQVAAAMHENAKALDQTITTGRQNRTDRNAVQRLELREEFAKVRADNDARLLTAFKPLYASLSPEQQQWPTSWSALTTISTIAPNPAASSPREAAEPSRRLFISPR